MSILPALLVVILVISPLVAFLYTFDKEEDQEELHD